MKTAIFSDIHANYPAFSACIADALRRSAECFVLLGDYVSDLPYPQRTMDAIYTLAANYPCHMVRGNREGYMLSFRAGEGDFQPGSHTGSLLYTYENLREKDLDFFASLPVYRTITINGVNMEIAHADFLDDRKVFKPEDDYLDTVFFRMQADILLTGHSHRQYICGRDRKTIVNPGAMGIPQGMPGWTQYALADIQPEGSSFQLLQIPYDLEQVIQEQFSSGLAAKANVWAISILNNLLTGKNRMLELQRRVQTIGGYHQETAWVKAAQEMGLVFEQEEMLKIARKAPAGK